MRKLSHYEHHWRTRREASVVDVETSPPVAVDDVEQPPAAVDDAETPVEPVDEVTSIDASTEASVDDETAAPESNAPAGETKAQRKARRKAERDAARRGAGEGG